MQVLPLPKILMGEGNAKPGHWSHHSDYNRVQQGSHCRGSLTRHQYKLQRAREFRKRPTPAERRAWELLRDRKLLGLKFRRQHRIRGFFADFYCHELRLVLEIDGPVHHTREQKAYDAKRTAILERIGLRVIRIPNETVSRETLLAVLSPHSRYGRGGQGVRH